MQYVKKPQMLLIFLATINHYYNHKPFHGLLWHVRFYLSSKIPICHHSTFYAGFGLHSIFKNPTKQNSSVAKKF